MIYQIVIQFLDRESELAELDHLYRQKGPQFLVVWGRRRVGKTELLTRFCEGKPAALYLARRLPLAEGVRDFLRVVARRAGTLPPAIEGWQDALPWALQALSSGGRRAIIILDEIPNLIEGDRSFLSSMQAAWDQGLRGRDVFLVAMGSSIGMMETHVLGYRSPLYGRRTAQLRVGPLPFRVVPGFLRGWGAVDAVRAYSVVGGVPAYLEKIDPAMGLDENLEALLFRRMGFLYEEPPAMLRQELREPGIYMLILEAMASGKTRLSEIASTAHQPVAHAAVYLRTLAEMALVERSWPVTSRVPRGKDTAWRVSDRLFSFWFRFVAPYRSEVEAGEGPSVWRRLRPELDAFTGPAYEEIALEFLRAQQARDPSGPPLRLGRWWHKDEEIDVVGLAGARRASLFGEVKWSDLRRGEAVRLLEGLRAKSERVPVDRSGARYAIVARSVEAKEELRRQGWLVWDLKDIVGRKSPRLRRKGKGHP